MGCGSSTNNNNKMPQGRILKNRKYYGPFNEGNSNNRSTNVDSNNYITFDYPNTVKQLKQMGENYRTKRAERKAKKVEELKNKTPPNNDEYKNTKQEEENIIISPDADDEIEEVVLSPISPEEVPGAAIEEDDQLAVT